MPTGLIIAAHGSDAEPDVNKRVRVLAAQIAALDLFDEVTAAFHRGRPRYVKALDAMSADTVVVVPLMTSQGYFADLVLPRALASAVRFPRVRIQQTSVVGRHPRIAQLVERRLGELLTRFDLVREATTLVLVGHGTPRHPESRTSTLECMAAVKSSRDIGVAAAAFLEDEPSIESVALATAEGDVVVIPFLIGRGAHASVDIAAAFGLHVSDRPELPILREVGGRRVVLDLPIGCHAEIMDLVVELASDALGRLRKAPA